MSGHAFGWCLAHDWSLPDSKNSSANYLPRKLWGQLYFGVLWVPLKKLLKWTTLNNTFGMVHFM